MVQNSSALNDVETQNCGKVRFHPGSFNYITPSQTLPLQLDSTVEGLTNYSPLTDESGEPQSLRLESKQKDGKHKLNSGFM